MIFLPTPTLTFALARSHSMTSKYDLTQCLGFEYPVQPVRFVSSRLVQS